MKYRGEPKTGKNQKQGRPEPDLSFFGYSNAISGNHGGYGTPRNKVCSAANVGEKLSPSQALDGSIATDRRINRDRQSVKIVCMFGIVWDSVYPSSLSEFLAVCLFVCVSDSRCLLVCVCVSVSLDELWTPP